MRDQGAPSDFHNFYGLFPYELIELAQRDSQQQRPSAGAGSGLT